MSRTDKDTPLWVRSNDSGERREAYHYQGNKYGYADIPMCWKECTINISTSVPRHEWLSHSNRVLRDYPCSYSIIISHNYHNTPHRSERRDLYHGPTRRAERAYAQSVRKAYNSSEDFEDIYEDADIYDAGERYIKRYWKW